MRITSSETKKFKPCGEKAQFIFGQEEPIEKRQCKKIVIESKENEDEDLVSFEAALLGHVWVRLNEQGKLETAPAHKSPPQEFDKVVDNIWKKGPLELRRSHPVGKTKESRSFFVQSLEGYSDKYYGNGYSFPKFQGKMLKATMMRFNGFQPLRSIRGMDGKIWEIWYLPGAWAAEGELRGKSEKEILDWLRYEVQPGTIALSGEEWGLSVPD